MDKTILQNQSCNSIEFILEVQQKTLYELKQELNQWQLNILYIQQLYQQLQRSNQESISIKKSDELCKNKNLSKYYSIGNQDQKFEKLESTNLILKIQSQISSVRNEINDFKQKYLQTFTQQLNNHFQQQIKQDNHYQTDQKHSQIIQNKQLQVSQQLMEFQKIEEVIVLKEFHENQQSITFVKPDQQDQYRSDSDLEEFYEQNFFPTNHINNQLKVGQNQSLLLIQLDCRSSLYQQLQPQIDLLTQQEKVNEIRVNKDYQQIVMIDKINDENGCLEQGQQADIKISQLVARFVIIIEYFYKRQAIYSIKNLKKPAFKEMFKSVQQKLGAFQLRLKEEKNLKQSFKEGDQNSIIKQIKKNNILQKGKFQCQKCLRYQKNRKNFRLHNNLYHKF
ncbi:hypothetical protein pb186bvf_008288 [Paramecium bursaria]